MTMPKRRVCADEHSSPLLEESNITEAEVIKARPYLMAKAKGDSSMERKHNEGSTRSQEGVRARPYRVRPGLVERQATGCRLSTGGSWCYCLRLG